MRIVTIKQELYKMFSEDKELLNKSRRPCVVVLRLKYKGRRYNFAVPLRSNIPAAAPKNQYFPLPPRPTTRPRNRHGIHYIKMFPIKKEYLLEYHTDISEEDIRRARDEGCREVWEIAEFLDLDEDFVRDALKHFGILDV